MATEAPPEHAPKVLDEVQLIPSASHFRRLGLGFGLVMQAAESFPNLLVAVVPQNHCGGIAGHNAIVGNIAPNGAVGSNNAMSPDADAGQND